MKILIEKETGFKAKILVDEICRRYPNKVKKYFKTTREIVLINEDVIKIVLENGNNDGMTADVAIGTQAKYFTCRSKEDKRIWTYDDLYDYLDKGGE